MDTAGKPRRSHQKAGRRKQETAQQRARTSSGGGDKWTKMSAGTGVHLDESEKQQRQKASAMHAIRQMIAGHRHLFGEEITDATDLFHAIDTDGGGTIERPEFDAALTRLGLGLSAAQLSEVWAGLDADGNGVVDYAELVSEVSPRHNRRQGGGKKKRSEKAATDGDWEASPGRTGSASSERSESARARRVQKLEEDMGFTFQPVINGKSRKLARRQHRLSSKSSKKGSGARSPAGSPRASSSPRQAWKPKGPKPAPTIPLQMSRTICYCARWVAQYGEPLEDIVRKKNVGHPAWSFLFEEPGSQLQAFYRRRLEFERQHLILQWAARVAGFSTNDIPIAAAVRVSPRAAPSANSKDGGVMDTSTIQVKQLDSELSALKQSVGSGSISQEAALQRIQQHELRMQAIEDSVSDSQFARAKLATMFQDIQRLRNACHSPQRTADVSVHLEHPESSVSVAKMQHPDSVQTKAQTADGSEDLHKLEDLYQRWQQKVAEFDSGFDHAVSALTNGLDAAKQAGDDAFSPDPATVRNETGDISEEVKLKANEFDVDESARLACQNQTLYITCPPGAKGGDNLNVTTTDGYDVEVAVPAGILPGQDFVAVVLSDDPHGPHWSHWSQLGSQLSGDSTDVSGAAGHVSPRTSSAHEFDAGQVDRSSVLASFKNVTGNVPNASGAMEAEYDALMNSIMDTGTPMDSISLGSERADDKAEDGTYMLVASPDGAQPGDIVIVTAPDGSELEVQVPDGIESGGEFEVYLGGLEDYEATSPDTTTDLADEASHMPLEAAVAAARELARAQLGLDPVGSEDETSEDETSGDETVGFLAPFSAVQFTSRANGGQSGQAQPAPTLVQSPEGGQMTNIEAAIDAARGGAQLKIHEEQQLAEAQTAEWGSREEERALALAAFIAHETAEADAAVAEVEAAVVAAREVVRTRLQLNQHPQASSAAGKAATAQLSLESTASIGTEDGRQASGGVRLEEEMQTMRELLMAGAREEVRVWLEQEKRKFRMEMMDLHTTSSSPQTIENRAPMLSPVADVQIEPVLLSELSYPPIQAQDTSSTRALPDATAAVQDSNGSRVLPPHDRNPWFEAEQLTRQQAEAHALAASLLCAVLVEQHREETERNEKTEQALRTSIHEHQVNLRALEFEHARGIEHQASINRLCAATAVEDATLMLSQAEEANDSKTRARIAEHEAALQAQRDVHTREQATSAAAAAEQEVQQRRASEQDKEEVGRRHQLELSEKCSGHAMVQAQLQSEHVEASAQLKARSKSHLVAAKGEYDASILAMRKEHEELLHATSWRARVSVEQEVQQKVKEELRRKIESEKDMLRSELADEHEAELRASQQRAAEIGRAMMGIIRK